MTSRVEIDALTDQEKGVLLAKAMGWLWKVGIVWFWNDGKDDYIIGSPKNIENQVPNLYKPVNMALALRALHWIGNRGYDDLLDMWFRDHGILWMKDAQRLWLDKILELAIEASIIELEQEKENGSG